MVMEKKYTKDYIKKIKRMLVASLSVKRAALLWRVTLY